MGLIVQHIWMRWTKRSRGANAPLTRPRLQEAYRLPADQAGALAAGVAWVHEIKAVEADGFEIRETFRAGSDKPGVVDLGVLKATPGIDYWVSLHDPSPYRRRTKWPAKLPSPLFELRRGHVARIDWNGRFRMSTMGSNLSYYFEQHIYWLKIVGAPEHDPFTGVVPWKHVDLRTEIY
ncbi:hypothetical protein E2493_04500 [Sphingomonas parva]|uniref:Uncharacterized protein n=1 Tax=Sphingomonas parva TaxID=2555898 RepID=A0A4Y8ZVF4_9SPHN|nr:hypothetical protein [Sphingomonas parva]TFI59457.1 hypothetical protein E2493_04500 [Sphingomonas parva]